MEREVRLREVLCRSALNKTGIRGYDYCLNPYLGCAHACVYCYASFMCRFADRSEPWGTFVDAKVNFPAVLAKQVHRRKGEPVGRILLGTVTDAYQPLEAHYQITRSSLEILAPFPSLEVHILTKSDLVLRDLPLLRRLKGIEVGFTLTTLDPDVAQIIEPGASSPSKRLSAARILKKEGIRVWVFIAPLLPGLTDTESSLDVLVSGLEHAGINEVEWDFLNPYPAVVHRLQAIYSSRFPRALPALGAYLQCPEAHHRQVGDLLLRRLKIQPWAKNPK